MRTEVCDVLVIGSGGAGLRTAIALKERGVDVLVVGKCKKREAHTIMARGGINAALKTMDPKDSWQLHAADTIRDGGGINDARAVELLCKHAPRAIRELVDWGVRFHREPNGKVSQRFFGAATYRRACFVGDHTGKEILNVLVDQVLQRNVRFKSEVYIFSLLQARGRVNGAVGLEVNTGKIIVFQAKAIVLATGGHSRMFSRSSSFFWENNGDGIALAYQVGARFQDMEMFQFHPTGMLWPPEAAGILVTEAVRGEGGILTNAYGGRFMKRYDPERMELSARDVVARAIWEEVKAGRGTRRGGVWLDVSHLSKATLQKRLPTMVRQFKQYAHVDISREKMEVAPTAHYSMGGIRVDHRTGRTSVNGLYAVGEVTGGTHGANRLGGNSLAELVVFGRLNGATIARDLKDIPLENKEIDRVLERFRALCSTSGEDPVKVKRALQQRMWKAVGIERSSREMVAALKALENYQRMGMNTGTSLKRNRRLIAALDVRNMLPTCEMILRSALLRKESRGAHFRRDYQRLDPRWKKNILCIPTKRGIKLSTSRVAAVPPRILQLMRGSRGVHLLE